MKRGKSNQYMYRCVAIFCILFAIGAIAGCKKSSDDGTPLSLSRMSPPGVRLKLTEESDSRAKVTGVTIEAEAIDAGDDTADVVIEPVVISNPTFPLHVPLAVYIPPCRYRITVKIFLTDGSPHAGSTIADACQGTDVDIFIATSGEITIPLPPEEECLLGEECFPEECLPGEECFPEGCLPGEECFPEEFPPEECPPGEECFPEEECLPGEECFPEEEFPPEECSPGEECFPEEFSPEEECPPGEECFPEEECPPGEECFPEEEFPPEEECPPGEECFPEEEFPPEEECPPGEECFPEEEPPEEEPPEEEPPEEEPPEEEPPPPPGP